MQANNEIKHLKLEDIIPNRVQPRTEFDEEKLNELATSIKQYGVINPIIVRQVGNKYEIIAGERRYKASKIAGLNQIPAIISNMDDSTSAEVAIIENIQRQDLSSLEEARSYRKLLDQGNITQEQLANKMGKTQSTIANKMRLLNLCDEVQEALEKNQISERHARSLLQLKNIDYQREMLEKIIAEKMTVKATETAIKEKLQSINLNSNIEMIDNKIVPPPELTENIYGNDVVNIMDLNKKELEKDNDNMNNNEQNIQLNPGLVQNPNMTGQFSQTNQSMPAFGGRFFPSLEDQETNLNLNNPFESTILTPNPSPVQNSVAQPMMENLVDQTLTNIPPIQPDEVANIPNFVTNNQTAPVMTNQVMDNIVTPEINLPPMADIQPTNVEPRVEIPQPEFVTTPPISPLNVQPEIQQPVSNNSFVVEPIINPIENTIPQPQVVEPIPNVPAQPQLQPMEQEPFVAPKIAPPITEAPTELTPITEPVTENLQPQTPIPMAPELVPTPEYKTTDNIINAINALKNLGLSIGSIGYKTIIEEEDTPNSYKITIEIEK